jgi:hypothetical protein
LFGGSDQEWAGMDPLSAEVQERLAGTALGLAGERSLRLNEDADRQLRQLAARATDVLLAEDKLGDESAVAQVSSSFGRLITAIESLEPEVRRGAAKPAVTGQRVNKALDSLCPGFWPFC